MANLQELFTTFRDRDYVWNEQYARQRNDKLTTVERCARVLAFHERFLLAQSMYERYVEERLEQQKRQEESGSLPAHAVKVTAAEVEFFQERISVWQTRVEEEVKALEKKTD